MLYIIIGCGLLGSNISIMTPGWETLLIDNDSFDEKHKILACYSKDLKINAIANYREIHCMKKVKSIIPFRFEELGYGFMSWCASQDGIIIDATDGINSSRNIGVLARKFNIPVINGKVSNNKGIVRVFPGKDNIGFCCLGIKGEANYVSCFGIQTTEVIPPTNATLAVASAVSALMVANAETICSAEEAYEIRVDLDRNDFQKNYFKGVVPCQKHNKQIEKDIRIFNIDENSHKTKLADLIIKANDLCNENDMVLAQPFPLARSMICNKCKKIQVGYKFIGARVFKCNCGGEMLVQQNSIWNKDHITLEDAYQMNDSLIDLGLPLWHRYKLYNEGCEIILEVKGDKCLLLRE